MRGQRLELVVSAFALAVIGVACAVILSYLTGCAEQVVPSGDTDACEQLAHRNGAEECATVYAFARPAENELGHVEMCVRVDDLTAAERMNGPSWPSSSERFSPYRDLGIDPPCFWRCDGQPGCNAFDGCFGCSTEGAKE